MTSEDVDAYIASAPDVARPLLEELRTVLLAAAPGAEERISYRVPTLFLHGGLVAYSAHRDHVGLHLMSPATMDRFRGELSGYRTTTATVHLPYGRPVPVGLVGRLVAARIEGNRRRRGL